MTATAIVLHNAPSSLDLPRASRLSRSVYVALLSLATAADAAPLCVSATEAAAGQTRPYAIPAEQSGNVPSRFAREADVTLSATPAQTSGCSSQGLHDSLTAQQGLARLLADTPLEAEDQGNGSFVLREAPAKDGDVLSMQAVGIFALGNNLGNTDGYLVTHSQIATKTNKPLLETNQAVSVIAREQIDNTTSKTVQQVMRYTPGILIGQVGASNRYDYIVMRGFANNSMDNIYLDGLKVMGDNGTFSSMQVDPYFLKRIDILKGPSSVLYGRSLSGGLVALTSKKPSYEDYRQITGSIDNMGQREMGFNFSGPLGEGKHIAYRLVGLSRGSDTQSDHVKEGRYAITPALAIDFSDNTTLTLQGYLQHDPSGGYHGGVPADDILLHYNGRHISREFFDDEPSKDDFDHVQRIFGYQLEHRIDDVWSAWQNLHYLDSDVDLSQVYAYGWSVSEPNKLDRYFGGAREHLQAYIVGNMLQAEFATSTARHTLFTGLDYRRRRTVIDWRSDSASTLSAFNPIYGNDAISYLPDDNHTRRLGRASVYLQDLINVDQWHFSLGPCQDQVSVADKNRSTGSKADDDWEKFTERIGALYLFDNGLAPYVNYSESFNPNAYSDTPGTSLAPTEGKQWELGLRFRAPGSNNFYTTPLFHITQENVASKEPQDNFYTSVDEVCSQEFEPEAHTQLSDDLKLPGSYTYTDIIYTKSLDGSQGCTPNRTPKHMASLQAGYAFDAGPLSGLSVGGGAHYIGETWANKENTLRVPGYTPVDARIGYNPGKLGLKGLNVSLNTNNLLDKGYAASCYSLGFCYFGEKRNITATVSYQF